MIQNYTCDENGNYYFGKHKMLVNFIRGCDVRRGNPRFRYNPDYEPLYIKEYYPGPIGCTVALFDRYQIRYGYSRVNINKKDRFNKKRAVDMAVGRAMMNNIEPPFWTDTVPSLIVPELERMYGRAQNYFRYMNTISV